MYLTLDIGNSNIVGGIFHSHPGALTVIHSFRLVTPSSTTTDELALSIKSMLQHKNIKIENIQSAIFASVVPSVNHNITKLMQLYFNIKIETVTHQHFKDFTIFYKEIEDLGIDRLTNIKAVHTLYQRPAIIIDFGTAITVDVLDENSQYLGGLILPGLAIALDALIHRTSQLPKVELEYPKKILGNTTKSCIQNGVYFLYKTAIESIVHDIKHRYFAAHSSAPHPNSSNITLPNNAKHSQMSHAAPPTPPNASYTEYSEPTAPRPPNPDGTSSHASLSRTSPQKTKKGTKIEPIVIATGGLAPFITHQFTSQVEHVPFLTLLGLKILLDNHHST